MAKLKVCKFGGSSLANSVQIKKVAEILRSDKERRIAVVSTPKGVTCFLIDCAKQSFKTGNFPKAPFERIARIYDEIGTNLGVKKLTDEAIEELRTRISTKTFYYKEYEDFLKSWGEYSCAKIIAEYLNKEGLKSTFLTPFEAGFYVTEDYSNARVLEETYKNVKKTMSGEPNVIVFPGFYGRTKTGKIATMSRGGSDLTGSVIAAALKADMYENWTDQDGIKNADPNVVKNPEQIKMITYKEIRELAYRGFKVFHAEAMIPAMRNGIPINIRNTNNPKNNGTYIIHLREKNDKPIIGIAGKNKFAVFSVEKVLMDAEVGFGRRLLEIFEEQGLSYEHSPSGIDSISVILDQTQLNDTMTKKILEKIKERLSPEKVTVEFDKCLISIVGYGLKRTHGISARITGALAKARINIEMLNQGASEISLIIGIDQKNEGKALNAIYDEFFQREGR